MLILKSITMKKTIIYLSLAIITVGSAAFASNAVEPAQFEMFAQRNNNTPLGNAICKGDVEAVKKFIEYGANVNETSNGLTPLMLAARYNNVEIINLLIEKGANLRAKDEKGFTALRYAELSNAQDAVGIIKAAMDA